MGNVILEDDDQKTNATHPANEATTANGPSYEVDFGNQDLMTKGDGFDKISPPESNKSNAVRINMLYDVLKPQARWVHFITGKGPFICNSERDPKGLVTKLAPCCRKLQNDDKQKAQLNVLILAFWYKNVDQKTGKFVTKKDREGNLYQDPLEWEIGYIKLTRSGYRRVSNMIQEDKKPHDLDVLITWKDNGIGFDYNVISSTCRFRQNEELLAEVLEAAAKFKDGSALRKKLGKQATDLEWAMILGSASTKASDAVVDDVSDLA